MANCGTNKHTYARSGEQINFGGVNSCMTITCTLTDGSRVAGHFSTETDSHRVTDEHARDFLLTLMNTEIRAHSGTVQSILAKGSKEGWTPDLLPQNVMFTRARRRAPFGDSLAEVAAHYDLVYAESMAQKENEFKDFVYRWFQCPRNAVEIVDWSVMGRDLVV